MYIPSTWRSKITNVYTDTDGMSAADVIRCQSGNDIFYIKSIDVKYSTTTYGVRREKDVMLWLNGKLNVPTVVDWGLEDNREFVVMNELTGTHIDDMVSNPDEYVAYLAKCIKLIQSIDISECPFDSGIDVRLKELEYLLKNDLVSLDDWEDTTKFTDPNELFQWLCNNRPLEEPVFSHGDITANFFINGSGLWFYDLARAGIADKWLDIAFCVCNIRDYDDGKKYEDKFFELLDIKPDYEKIEYFILLDEMF